MLRRTFAFLCLASLGALCDRALHPVFCTQSARRLGQVGQDLVSAAASPDGKSVAGLRCEGPEKWSVTVWETTTGRVQLKPQTLPHPPATTNALAWSPNSQFLAVGSSSEVSLFHLSGQTRKRLAAQWLVRDVRFSQDYVMARADGAVFVWRWDSGTLVLKLTQDHLLAAALNGPGGVLATASFQDNIRLYGLANGRLMRTLPAGPATIGLEFARQGHSLAAAFRFQSNRSRDYAVVYDWSSGQPKATDLSQPDIMGFAVSQDGNRLLTRSEQLCRIWDGNTGKLVLERPLASPYTDSLSSDGQLVGSLGPQGNNVALWRADSGREFARLEHTRRPFSYKFFQPGLFQVVDGACSVWQVTARG
ncbi:WD40 repeat domain-containing protein [bacterium]|nr:WD40 repeat domain-containing protein [bacterium]